MKGEPSLHEQNEADRDPDDEEKRQDPEEKSRLADREPGQLASTEEKPGATDRLRMSTVLEHLTLYGFRRVLGGTACGVEVRDPSLPIGSRNTALLGSHVMSLPPDPALNPLG